MNPNNIEIPEEIKSLPADEAIARLDVIIEHNPNFEEAYMLRGMKLWSLSKRKEAISDYLSAIRINPQSKARTLLEFANSILGYYNKDLLNP